MTEIPKPICPLNPRQLEVLYWVDVGLTNAEIAERLGLSPNTVKNHINNAVNLLLDNGVLTEEKISRKSGVYRYLAADAVINAQWIES